MTPYSMYDRLSFVYQEFLQTSRKYTKRKMNKGHEKTVHKITNIPGWRCKKMYTF